MRLYPIWAALAFLAGVASADVAVGVRLPLEDLSVWNLEGRTAWGLSVSASASRIDNENVRLASSEGLQIIDFDRQSRSGSIAVTRIRLRETGRAVRPFYFLEGKGVFGVEYEDGILRKRGTSFYATAGIGVGWQPFQRVGVWVRKGLAVSYQRTSFPIEGAGPDSILRALSFNLRQTPQAVAYFIF